MFWPFYKIDGLLYHLAFLQHFLCKFYLFLLSVSSFDLGENQKRWVVIGICLNRLLLPVLRDFASQEIPKHYTSLKSKHGIDTHVCGSHLPRDKKIKLNYGNINNNWRKKKVHMITKLEQLKTWLNFISSHAWPSLQVLITPIGIKSENVNFLYKSPRKHSFMHYTCPLQGEPDCSLGIQSTVS